jgi:predicted nucleic acid-binding protein
MAAVTKETVRVALDMIKRYHVAPRDAIHAATASAEKADSIISTDPHFDKIKKLKKTNMTSPHQC